MCSVKNRRWLVNHYAGQWRFATFVKFDKQIFKEYYLNLVYSKKFKLSKACQMKIKQCILNLVYTLHFMNFTNLTDEITETLNDVIINYRPPACQTLLVFCYYKSSTRLVCTSTMGITL